MFIDSYQVQDALNAVKRWGGIMSPQRYLRRAAVLQKLGASYSTHKPTGLPVVFDITQSKFELHQGRYAYTTVALFRDPGRSVYFIPRPGFTAAFDRAPYKKLLLDGTVLPARVRDLDQPFWYVTDNWRKAKKMSQHDLCSKVLLLQYSAPPQDTDFPWYLLPYPMHPVMYQDRSREEVLALRRADPSFGVLFGGADNALNSRPVFLGSEELLGRGRALSFLKGTKEVPTRAVDAYKELWDVRAQNALVLASGSQGRIPVEEWLGVLARARFFLALPGAMKPFAHNIVESLFVGAVPVTEYGDIFCPPLRDGIECIRFSGKEQLVKALRRALSMDERDYRVMSTNATKYFDRYLDGAKFVEMLESSPHRLIGLCLPVVGTMRNAPLRCSGLSQWPEKGQY